MTVGEDHVLNALVRLMQEGRELILEHGEPGLRPSHHRVIAQVPQDGVTLTELADRVGMTKQGVGQFVNQLTGSGHLRVATTSEDRRVRVVRRTPKGERSARRLSRLLDDLERAWAERVGATRYREFRHILDEIALG